MSLVVWKKEQGQELGRDLEAAQGGRGDRLQGCTRL